MDGPVRDTLVLRHRAGCPVPTSMVGGGSGKEKVSKHTYEREEENYEHEKAENGISASGYLIGRHRECGMLYKTYDD